MHIGNPANSIISNFFSATRSQVSAANFDLKVEEVAGPKVPFKEVSAAEKIAARYDLNDISPREIDQMATELHEGGHISDLEYMTMSARGAEFLSHLPGNYYTEGRLNQKTDLIGDVQAAIELAERTGSPTGSTKELLAMLEKMQSLAIGKEKDGVLPQSPVAHGTMSALLAQQEFKDGIPVDQARAIDLSLHTIQTASPEMVDRMKAGEAGIFLQPNIPPVGAFAEIKVGGRVIAKVDNGGGVTASNAMSGQFNALFKNELSRGPALAEERAQKIAEAFGGDIEYSSTSQSQREWMGRPQTTWSIDAERMAKFGYEVPADIGNRQFASRTLGLEAIKALQDQRET